MSATQRPRLVIDGVQSDRTYRFFRCGWCARIIRLDALELSNDVCPHCYERLSPELEVPTPPRLAPRNIDPSSLLDTLAFLLDPSTEGQTLFDSPQNPPASVDRRADGVHDEEFNDAVNLCLTSVEVKPEALTGSDSSTCPVCKDEFMVSELIREMPCKHQYHSECILPWLQINNSCPVCRYEVPLPPPRTSSGPSSSFTGGFESGGRRGSGEPEFRFEDVLDMSLSWSWIWIQLFSSWPLRLLLNWIYQGGDSDNANNNPWQQRHQQQQQHETLHERASRTVNAWWQYFSVL